MNSKTLLITAFSASVILASCHRDSSDEMNPSDSSSAQRTDQTSSVTPAPLAKASDRSWGKEPIGSFETLIESKISQRKMDMAPDPGDPERTEKVRQAIARVTRQAEAEGVRPIDYLTRRENAMDHSIIGIFATFEEIVKAFGTEKQRKFYYPD